MMSVATKSKAAATRATDPAENPSDFQRDSTRAEALSYASALDDLTADDLQTLSSLLHDRATRQRVKIEYDTALALVENTRISPSAELSPYKEIIRVRVALRRLIERGTFHPEQLRGVFLIIAYDRAPHPLCATAAVDLAIEDGLANRKEGRRNDN